MARAACDPKTVHYRDRTLARAVVGSHVALPVVLKLLHAGLLISSRHGRRTPGLMFVVAWHSVSREDERL